MDEISNKTLATLLVVAIVISLAGTFFAMRGVSQVTNVISGAQTASGTAKVNITEQLSISMVENLVDFGAGNRLTTLAVDSECNLTSADNAVPDCWNDTGSNYAGVHDFKIMNDGNLNANVTVTSAKDPTEFFTTCAGSGTILGGTPDYQFKSLASATENGCLSGTVDTFTSFDKSAQLICTNLTFTDGTDKMNVSIRLQVPAGPAGVCTDAVTFTAARNY
ncbi:hypothetical protein JW898_00110 [Candidatus Woesearchaeota archaeon]|nr:hypothetical protein [Candidatus Woesearchaeota archaeon]